MSFVNRAILAIPTSLLFLVLLGPYPVEGGGSANTERGPEAGSALIPGRGVFPVSPTREPSVGVTEVPRADGGRDRINYSVTPEFERRAREQAERNKQEQSLEQLGNIIIIGR